MLTVDRVLESWSLGRNVLLYGPPGTGKTRFLSQLYSRIEAENGRQNQLVARPEDPSLPLAYSATQDPLIPGPIKSYWATFHQSYGYEDFILGYRPRVEHGGVTLQPYAGILVDAVLELIDESSENQSAVIFIDEVNRANASRVFGEFMTFLDFDYRESGTIPLPMPLRQLGFSDGKSEPILRLDGSYATLEYGFHFPKNIFIVATMNSVDRSAVPIDSALARRFNRMEMPPERFVLETAWEISGGTAIYPDQHYTAYEVALRLFDSLNSQIASDLGAEFELGHGLFLGLAGTHAKAVVDQGLADDAWYDLARLWDDVLFPQLEDRYAGRPDSMIQLLRIPEFGGDRYLWELRDIPSQDSSVRTLKRVQTAEATLEMIQSSFTRLVSDR